MGLSLSRPERCFRTDDCQGNAVTYRREFNFDRVIPYDKLLKISSQQTMLKEYFSEAWHFGSRSGLLFRACDNCIKEEHKELFEYNKDGWYTSRLS